MIKTKISKYLLSMEGRRLTAGLAFLTPSLLLIVTFIVVPICFAFFLSLTKWRVLGAPQQFIGIQNYIYWFKNPYFYKIFFNTLYFAGVKIPLDLLISLSIALLLNRGIRGLTFYRTVFFLPVITSMVAVAAVWMWIYDPQMGLLNYILTSVGLSPLGWLSDPKWAMPAIIITSTWKGLGYNIVIFLAGLQGIPVKFYEAAKVDGANAWQTFWNVTLPMLSPVIYFVIIIGVINSFKIFTQIHVMTPNGGPLNSTAVFVYEIYNRSFNQYKFGQAAALSFIMFVIVVIFTFAQQKFGSKRVHYE